MTDATRMVSGPKPGQIYRRKLRTSRVLLLSARDRRVFQIFG
jgi:hypothetical protein